VWHSRPRLWNFALEELKRNAPKKRPKSLLTISELQPKLRDKLPFPVLNSAQPPEWNYGSCTGIPSPRAEKRVRHCHSHWHPPKNYYYRRGNRSGITNDPNRPDDKEYILRVIGQVFTVSLETVKIVNALPDLGLPKEDS
jgi:hypothetical protein